jgi:hypothetical protein
MTFAQSSSNSFSSNVAPFQPAALAPALGGSGNVEADGHDASSIPGHGAAHGPRGRRRLVAFVMSVIVCAPQWRWHLPPCSHSINGEVWQQDGGGA